MNQTNIVFAAIAALALLMAGSAQTNKATAPVPGQVGRYQLVYGEHQVLAPKGVDITVKSVFRIDTVTGKTSFFSTILPDPAKNEPYVEEWHPISEFK